MRKLNCIYIKESEFLKEMVTHSSILAWKIPRTEEPGRLQSMAKGGVSEAEGRLHTGSWEDVVLWENQHTT